MLDFEDLHKYQENNRIEAKKAQGGLPHSIWETYSAFANTYGGILLLGVVEEADKSLRAVPLPAPEKLVEAFWAKVNDRAVVSANILSAQHVRIVESGGCRVVAIEVPRARRQDRPVYIGADPLTGSYRRNGEGDYRCSAQEVRAMLRDQAAVSQDTRVLEHMTAEVFDADSIRRYRRRFEELHPGHAWLALEQPAFLARLGAMARGGAGELCPTAAGLLMFGREREIVREYPCYFLEYQEYAAPAAEGEESRRAARIVSDSGEWSGNLFDFYFRVYRRIARDIPPAAPGQAAVAQAAPDGPAGRRACPPPGRAAAQDAPVHRALREALANALIHADYHDRRGLVIQKWPERICIANPGAFRVQVQDALAGGAHDPRNATITGMFALIGIGGHTGGGLPGIRAAWQAQGWQEPQIAESFGPDRTSLTLPLKAAGDKRRQGPPAGPRGRVAAWYKQRILEYLTDAAQATAAQIAAALEMEPSRVRGYLRALKAQGSVIAEGEQRPRRYRLKR